MRKILLAFTLMALSLTATAASNAQVASATAGATRPSQQQHLVGEVTAVDSATRQLTVKTDTGSSVTVTFDDRTTYRRVPPGQTSLENAERITSAEVSIGDRVLVPNGATGGTVAVRQIIVMAREAVASKRAQERDDWRARGVSGRVTAIDATKKEITVEARSREGAEAVIIVASANNVRFRRYAPGSLRPADAVPGSFADVRVGDQLRGLGNRDGARFAAEEIISGTIARLTGMVEAVDAARGEVTVKENQTGRTIIVALLPNTVLRRVPTEYAETLRQRREQRREGRAANEGQAGERQRPRRDPNNQGGERQRPGGRGAQGMYENFPAITTADLKKSDAVMVMGTAGADAARVTAATLITGDAELLQQMQRQQRGGGGRNRSDNASPGLPGTVIGGGTGDREP